jgi:isopentenyl-diphosphate delta-isomerase
MSKEKNNGNAKNLGTSAKLIYLCPMVAFTSTSNGPHAQHLEERKSAHIDLAFASQTDAVQSDSRFFYEPGLSGHPKNSLTPFEFLGKEFHAPIWISSMTGGTEMARHINRNLARACAEFGLGMGLGSCRPLLEGNERFDDFNLRPILGNDRPFYANLGVAQLEELFAAGQGKRITELVESIQADGLIIHINPLQEWFQPEGDRYFRSPVDLTEEVLRMVQFPVIVKEVGQGMGPETIRAFLKLPIAALDFGAFGGTNFSKLEMLRDKHGRATQFEPLIHVGHTAGDMMNFVNRTAEEEGNRLRCRAVIVSGGISSFLDGYYHTEKLHLPAIYGQASAFLKHATGEYENLASFIRAQIDGLQVAKALLRIKE